MTLMLSKSEVSSLLDLDQAMSCMRDVFRSAGNDHDVAPAPPYLVRTGKSFMRITSGGVGSLDRMTLRVNTRGPASTATALLFDAEDGALLSVMAYPFAELRLASTVGIATEALARNDARKVGMIGTGSNALGLLEAVCKVRDVESISVFSRDHQRREAFAARVGQALAPTATAVDGPEAAIEGAGIIVVATNSPTAALRGASLPDNVLVIAIGLRTEIDEEVFLRSNLFVTTSKVHELNIMEANETWPIVRLVNSGRLDMDKVVELGDVIAGKVGPSDGITLFREAQGGFTDVALASWVYDRAIQQGLGRSLPLES